MAIDRRRKTDEKVKPFQNVEFRKPSLDAGTIQERRKFEANLRRYGLAGEIVTTPIPAAATAIQDITNITVTGDVVTGPPPSPQYWEKVGDDLWYTQGNVYSTGGSGDTAITVAQDAHGLAEGNVVKCTAANTYAKATADTAANAEVAGIVSKVANLNKFSLLMGGYLESTSVPVATAGTTVFLSPTTAGLMTVTAPTVGGQISKPLGIVIESGAKMLVFNMRGVTLDTLDQSDVDGLGTGDSPTWVGATLSGLTASVPVVTNGSKALASQTYANFKTSLVLAQADIPELTTASGPTFDHLHITNTIESADIQTLGPWVDVRRYASFAAAITAIGATETTLLIPTAQTVGADVTVPETTTLRFLRGGKITVSAGYIVTINGQIEAGSFQIFSGADTSNLLTNGDFATNDLTGWAAAAGWSAATGKAVHNGAIADTTALDSTFAVVAGRTYCLTFGISGRTAGSVKVSCGGRTSENKTIDATQYSWRFKAMTTATLKFTPTADFDGAIDNVVLISGSVVLGPVAGINVPAQWFGASTSNSAESNDIALEQALMSGRSLFFSKGGYLFSTPLIVPDHIKIAGESVHSETYLYFTGTGSYALKICNDVELENFLVSQSTDVVTGRAGIYIAESHNRLRDVMVSGFNVGIRFHGGGDTGCAYNHIYSPRFYSNFYDLYYSTSNDGWSNENQVFGGDVHGCGEANSYAIYINHDNGSGGHILNGNRFFGTSIESGTKAGVYCDGWYNEWHGCRFENGGNDITYGANAKGNLVVGTDVAAIVDTLNKNLFIRYTGAGFTGLTLSDLTASVPVVTDANKILTSQTYANFKTSLAIAQSDVSGLTTASGPTFDHLHLTDALYAESARLTQLATTCILNLYTYSDTAAHYCAIQTLRSHSDTEVNVETINGEALAGLNFFGVNTTPAVALGARILIVQNGAAGTYVPADMQFFVYDASAIHTALSLTTSGGVHVGGTSDVADNCLLVDGTGTITGAFGCNAKTAQTAYVSGGAVAPGAGAFGASSAPNFAALATLVANIRLALVANGIMS
jgi:hypothetical protein